MLKNLTVSNNYLYAGEQFDADFGFYYNRARYLNVETGRFVSMDSYEGNDFSPASLHKYLYADNNPINRIDPSGNFSVAEISIANSIRSVLSSFTDLQGNAILTQIQTGGDAGIKSLLIGIILPFAVIGAAISIKVAGGFLRRAPKVAQIAGKRGVIPNALNGFELLQAKEVTQFRGGIFEGAPTDSFPGIDGWLLDGAEKIPASLKRYEGTSVAGISKHVVDANTSALNAGYSGVELFVRARNVKADDLAKQLSSSSISRIPNEGTISVIHIHTKDGWVSIFPQNASWID